MREHLINIKQCEVGMLECETCRYRQPKID